MVSGDNLCMILTTLHNDLSGQRGEILLNSYIISGQTQIVFYLVSHFSSRHINFRQYQRNAWIFYPAQQTHRNIYLDFLQARHKNKKLFILKIKSFSIGSVLFRIYNWWPVSSLILCIWLQVIRQEVLKCATYMKILSEKSKQLL